MTVVVGFVGVQVALIAIGLLLPVGVGVGWLGLRTMDRTTLVPTRALDLLRAVPSSSRLPRRSSSPSSGGHVGSPLEPAEVLIREGDVGEAYYVLESGALSITQRDRRLGRSPERGDGVGEIALLQGMSRGRPPSPRSGRRCCWSLGRADFLEAVTGHPQAHDAARQVAAERAATEPG